MASCTVSKNKQSTACGRKDQGKLVTVSLEESKFNGLCNALT
ncbi:MAG: hypothetical protein ACJ705_06205 [Nitrososphaeraceae archaeon]